MDLGRAWELAQSQGDYAASWRIADLVLAGRDPRTRDNPALPYHLRWVWDGRPFDGARVLVRCYHGLGDTLQFARYLPPLAARAARLEVEAPPPLLPLLRPLPGIARWHPFDPARPLPPVECDIEIMELAHALRAGPEAPAYLRAAPAPAARGAIGLCLRAGTWDPDRSAPPDLLRAALAGRDVLSLEPGPARFPCRNPAGCPASLAATAAWIAALDLVITVDTAVAHLAGALGRPGLLLLKHTPDWRWRHGGARSPWYPSLRLIRQEAPGDWPSVARAVAARLTAAD